MKSYLRNKRREKEKNLKEINNLQSIIGSLNNKCIENDRCVKDVTLWIQNGLKGDNTGKLARSSTNINRNNYGKIREIISLVSTVRTKIQSEINSIDRQLREIERQEEAERRLREEERRRRQEE